MNHLIQLEGKLDEVIELASANRLASRVKNSSGVVSTPQLDNKIKLQTARTLKRRKRRGFLSDHEKKQLEAIKAKHNLSEKLDDALIELTTPAIRAYAAKYHRGTGRIPGIDGVGKVRPRVPRKKRGTKGERKVKMPRRSDSKSVRKGEYRTRETVNPNKLSAKLEDAMIYFQEQQQDPGVDPAVIQQVVNDARIMSQEGENRVAISQQLYQKLMHALQEFYINKNQVDASVIQEAVKDQ
jgi:hypothetical protein